MKYLWLVLPLLLAGCFHAVFYDQADVNDYVGISAGGTTGTVEYNCQLLKNNSEEAPVVCYFKNVSNKPGGSASVRIGWYSAASGEELTHTDWGGRFGLEPGQTERYYFFYNLVDLRLRCGYSFDRCVMLVDKKY